MSLWEDLNRDLASHSPYLTVKEDNQRSIVKIMENQQDIQTEQEMCCS